MFEPKATEADTETRTDGTAEAGQTDATTRADGQAVSPEELEQMRERLAAFEAMGDPEEVAKAKGFYDRLNSRDPGAYTEVQQYFGDTGKEKPAASKKPEAQQDNSGAEEAKREAYAARVERMNLQIDRQIEAKHGFDMTKADRTAILNTMAQHGVDAADALQLSGGAVVKKKIEAAKKAKKSAAAEQANRGGSGSRSGAAAGDKSAGKVESNKVSREQMAGARTTEARRELFKQLAASPAANDPMNRPGG